VFCVERHRNIEPDGSKGVFMLLKRTYAHPSPRTPQNIDFLFDELLLSDVLKAAFREPAKLANSPDKADALTVADSPEIKILPPNTGFGLCMNFETGPHKLFGREQFEKCCAKISRL
jgi:hypothetical protein